MESGAGSRNASRRLSRREKKTQKTVVGLSAMGFVKALVLHMKRSVDTQDLDKAILQETERLLYRALIHDKAFTMTIGKEEVDGSKILKIAKFALKRFNEHHHIMNHVHRPGSAEEDDANEAEVVEVDGKVKQTFTKLINDYGANSRGKPAAFSTFVMKLLEKSQNRHSDQPMGLLERIADVVAFALGEVPVELDGLPASFRRQLDPAAVRFRLIFDACLYVCGDHVKPVLEGVKEKMKEIVLDARGKHDDGAKLAGMLYDAVHDNMPNSRRRSRDKHGDGEAQEEKKTGDEGKNEEPHAKKAKTNFEKDPIDLTGSQQASFAVDLGLAPVTDNLDEQNELGADQEHPPLGFHNEKKAFDSQKQNLKQKQKLALETKQKKWKDDTEKWKGKKESDEKTDALKKIDDEKKQHDIEVNKQATERNSKRLKLVSAGKETSAILKGIEGVHLASNYELGLKKSATKSDEIEEEPDFKLDKFNCVVAAKRILKTNMVTLPFCGMICQNTTAPKCFVFNKPIDAVPHYLIPSKPALTITFGDQTARLLTRQSRL